AESGNAAADPGTDGRSARPAQGSLEATGNDVLAALRFPSALDASGGTAPPPSSMTLWIKPIVQLPNVADPVAHDVPLSWSASEGAEPIANVLVKEALAGARESGFSQVWLQAEAAGAAPASTLIDLEEDLPASVFFDLDPGVTVSGEVVDAATGDPIVGAVVVAIDQVPLDALDVAIDPSTERLPKPFALTDALGRFTVEHVRVEAKVLLRASADGFAPLERSVTLQAPERSSLRFEMTGGAAVSGLIERPDGTPFEGALLIVSKQDGDPAADVRPVMTFGADMADAAGRYQVENLPSGHYVVLLFDPKRGRIPLEFRQLQIRGTSAITVDFRAEASTTGLSLRGSLALPGGAPAPKTALTLTRLDQQIGSFSDWRVTDTDEKGTFRFADFEPGDYALHTATEGFARMQLIWTGRLESSQDLAVELVSNSLIVDVTGPGSLDGTWAILEAYYGDLATRTDGAVDDWIYAGRVPVSGNRGASRIELQNLAPGRYRAVLVGAGHGATWMDPVDVGASRDATSAVKLSPGGALEVVVLGTEGPLSGVILEALDPRGREVPQKEPAETGRDGRARLLSVPYGSVTLRIRPQGGAWQNRTVEFSAGSAALGPLTVQL
ncbi:MAG: carboxypeptidase-like regulatory domain-containing protein, partial [Planctomycetota bacterium]